MHEYDILTSFALLLFIAFTLGVIFNRLKLPVLIAYLTSGMLIGPFGFNLVSEIDVIQTISELGIILLMFLLGLSFPPKKILSIGIPSLLGGVAQIILTIVIIFTISLSLGLATNLAIFLGSVIALSSTAIVIKILNEFHQIDSNHGKLMVACLIVQDVAAIIMFVIFPNLNNFSSSWNTLIFTLIKGVLFLLVVYLLNKKVIPIVQGWVAEHGGRELFLIGTIVFCMGMAIVSHSLGLSFALGAFVAGLLVSESDYNFQIMSGMVPFRDAFLCIFFVALGLLFDPMSITKYPGAILGLFFIIVLGKFLITTGVYWISGSLLKTALMAGVGLSQVGEFSFVLFKIGLETELLNNDSYNILLSASILTMFISPFSFKYFPKVLSYLEQLPRMGALMSGREDAELEKITSQLSNHTIICGFGSIGVTIANALRKAKLEYLALDLNASQVKQLRKLDLKCFYGDSSSQEILKKLHIESARLVVVTTPDIEETERIIKSIKHLNPDCAILARSKFNREQEDLYEHGASFVIQEQFITGLEMLRTTLEELVIPAKVIEKEINAIRKDREELTHSRYFGPLTFSRMLSPNRIIVNLDTLSKEAAIQKLVTKMAELHSIKDSKELHKQVMVREAIENTGLGNEIAIPHTKTDLINQIGCVIGISHKGIEYDALDHKPVHIIILLIANTKANNKYLNTLGNISALFQDSKLIKELKVVNKPTKVIEIIKKKEEAIKGIRKNSK